MRQETGLEMRSYVLYSFAVHAAAVFLFASFVKPPSLRPKPVSYRIDFIGAPGRPAAKPGKRKGAKASKPKPTSMKPPPQPAPKPVQPPAAKPAPKVAAPPAFGTEPDEVSLPSARHTPLARPSMLEEADERPAEAPPAPSEGERGAEGGTQVTADFPNFPYPWYITRIRTQLWEQWTRRMPREGRLKARVGFSILPDGKIRRIDVEEKSGNSLFDYSALSAVRGAAPFAPLPAGFPEPQLNVHVEFRTIR